MATKPTDHPTSYTAPSDPEILSKKKFYQECLTKYTRQWQAAKMVGEYVWISAQAYLDVCGVHKPERARISPNLFPPGLKWEEITIRFLDGHEVILQIRGKNYHATFELMGFQDKRKKKFEDMTPNRQWELLRELAENGGEISWANKAANLKLKKQKQQLTKRLKRYFGIKEDPFYDYWKERSYRIRLRLVPERDPCE
ncbi:MAG: hypothetical protein QME66_12695 [Candidatus Eisenbacteria bacterium]|nr:hypothetical protein [Candidatus Eisenbacteria bacterium]